MSDYANEGYNFGVAPQPEPENDLSLKEKVQSYFSVASPIAQKVISPELQSYNDEDPSFDLKSYMEPLTPEQRNLVRNARNANYADSLLATNADFKSKLQNIEDDSAFIKYPALITASIFGDPLTLVPVGGAISKGKALLRTQKALNAAKDVAYFGTVGAGFALASEAQSVAAGQISEGDYATVGLFGFALGGGIVGLGHAFSPAEMVAVNSLNEKSRIITAELSGKKNVEPPKVTHWAAMGPSWTKSGILNVATSDNKVAREMAYRMDSPAMYGTLPDDTIAPMQANATDYKIGLQRVHTTYSMEANEAYNAAKAEGYKGTYADMSKDAYNVLQDGYAAQKAGLEFTFPNTPAGRQAKAFNEYTKRMLQEGKDLGIKQLSGHEGTRIYVPRLMDFDKILQASPVELRKRVVAAITKGGAFKTADEIQAAADEYIDNMNKLGYQREFADFAMFAPKDLPNTGRLQAKIPMDDRELGDFVIQDLNELSARYQYSQSGLYSVYKAFPEVKGMDTEEAMKTVREMFAKVRDEAITSGQDVDKAKVDFEALENMLQDLLGVLRMSDNPHSMGMKVARMSTKYNSIAHGGQFVVNAMAEMGNTVLSKKMKHVFSKEFAPAVKDVAKILYKGGKPDTDMIRTMMDMGLLSELTEFKGFIRHAEVDTMYSAGNVENWLNKGNQALYKYNLTTPMTAMLEVVNGMGAFNNLIELSKAGKANLKEKDLRTLSRLGVSVDDLEAIASIPFKTRDGYNVGIDFEKATPEMEAAIDTLMIASQREARQTVAKGIGSYSPDWVKKPTPIKLMALQFLRTPIEMNETLLRRGLSEDKAGMVVSTIGSVSIMASILYLREQAEVAAGFKTEVDTKYDFDDDEKWANLMYTSWSKVGVMGLASTFVEKGASAAGLPLPGREYADKDLVKSMLGASFSSADDAVRIMQSVASGDFGDSRSMHAAINLAPFHSLPIINEALRSWARDQ